MFVEAVLELSFGFSYVLFVTTLRNQTTTQDRFNEHRRPVDKRTNISKPTVVSEHFLSNDHNANDMQLIPLELMKSNFLSLFLTPVFKRCNTSCFSCYFSTTFYTLSLYCNVFALRVILCKTLKKKGCAF